MSRLFAALLIALALFAAPAYAGTSLRITITGDMQSLAAGDNAQKSREAATLLAADRRLAGLPLSVRIVAGVAQLKGRVYNNAERELAARIVGELPGVDQVENGIVTLEAFMPTTRANLGQDAGTINT